MGIKSPTVFTKLLRKRCPAAILPWTGWSTYKRVGVDFAAILHACAYRERSHLDSDSLPERCGSYVCGMQRAGCQVVVFVDGKAHGPAKVAERARREALRVRTEELRTKKQAALASIASLLDNGDDAPAATEVLATAAEASLLLRHSDLVKPKRSLRWTKVAKPTWCHGASDAEMIELCRISDEVVRGMTLAEHDAQ